MKLRLARVYVALVCALCAGLLVGKGHAADLQAAPPASPASVNDWQYQLTLYGWATSLAGDVGVRHLPTTSIDLPFSQVLKNLDGALMGSVFARNGDWLLLADLVFAKLSHQWPLQALGGSGLGVGINQTVASGAVGYMLPTGRSDMDFAVTAGLRYMSVKGALSFETHAPLPSLSASQRQWWLDPTIGFFAHWDVNDKWFINAIADIGGFGAGSKLSSTGYLGAGYMWTKSFSTALGYRYLYEDYEGSGARTGTFRYNTTMHGPVVAAAWRF